MLNNR